MAKAMEAAEMLPQEDNQRKTLNRAKEKANVGLRLSLLLPKAAHAKQTLPND